LPDCGFARLTPRVFLTRGSLRWAARLYYFLVVIVVLRHETTAAARWALLFIVRTFFNDAFTVAVWIGFHVRLV
jgi:hypothetical protein